MTDFGLGGGTSGNGLLGLATDGRDVGGALALSRLLIRGLRGSDSLGDDSLLTLDGSLSWTECGSRRANLGSSFWSRSIVEGDNLGVVVVITEEVSVVVGVTFSLKPIEVLIS